MKIVKDCYQLPPRELWNNPNIKNKNEKTLYDLCV